MVRKPKLAKTSKDAEIASLVRVVAPKLLVIWASDCAKRVLPLFEVHFPGDKRPRNAVRTARAWVKDKITTADARKAAFIAHAAARDIGNNDAAVAAARAAGHAAAATHVATHAIAAAVYAISAIRDSKKKFDQEDLEKERRWQLQHLYHLIRVQ